MMVFGKVWILKKIINIFKNYGKLILSGRKNKLNILIVGGFGFIGLRLAEYFYLKNYNIFISTSRKTKNLFNNKKFKIIHLSFKNYKKLININTHIDIIIYCSGIDSFKSNNNYKLAKNINSDMAKDIGIIAKKIKVKKYIYLSTIHTYSSNLDKNYKENYKQNNSLNYSLTNIFAERYLNKLSKSSKYTHFIIFRLSNAFGYPVVKKSNSWNLIINNIVYNFYKYKFFSLNTYGNQKRDFIAISDICDITLFFLKKKFYKNKKYSVYNISSGKSISVRNVLNKIKKQLEQKLNQNLKIKFNIKEKEKNSINYNINNSKLIKLGFKFNNNFNKELKKLYKFCEINKI